jgi:Flp pilus assembly pilin Flp
VSCDDHLREKLRVVWRLRLHGPVALPSRRAKGRKDMLLNVTTRVFNAFRRNEDGQDLLEYALLVALIAIVAIFGVTLAGNEVDSIFKDIVAQLPGGA